MEGNGGDIDWAEEYAAMHCVRRGKQRSTGFIFHVVKSK